MSRGDRYLRFIHSSKLKKTRNIRVDHRVFTLDDLILNERRKMEGTLINKHTVYAISTTHTGARYHIATCKLMYNDHKQTS